VRRDIRRDLHHAYYDLVAARTLRGLVERQQQIAGSILPATEARYVSGTAAQADVLKARNEAALLIDERNAAVELERAALAQLNALLDQPSTTPVAGDSLSSHVIDIAAVLPTLDSMQTLAAQANPRLRERRAIIAGQTAAADLAAREHLPDFDVTLQYGQRDRLPDMITAAISVPIAVQRGSKQSAEARAARFDLTAAEAELRGEENAIRSEVAQAYAAVERSRANIDLLDRAILPQARATFASASATYQSGRGELLGVLDAMRAMFATETMYVRTIAEYAKALAELEALVGQEVMP
jgi:cobalt-zinc-cadmium efflux system outer membrane protein